MREGERVDILITGAKGQLGKALERKLCDTHSVISLDKKELDVTNKEATEEIISFYKPQIIIHAAAFTAVDQCEIEFKKAFEVNSLGAGYVAQAANNVNACMYYISSDYVFDGNKKTPYGEEDTPNPQSIYGMSKWLGEKLVLKYTNGTVIRTSWLYGHDGKNFVKTMLELAGKNKEIKVVTDQVGSPTYVNDLTETIVQLFHKKNGIYHVSNSESCTWYTFARTILEEAGFNPNLILPTTSEEFGTPAPRPRHSVLGQYALSREKIKTLRPWNEALKEFIQEGVYK